MRIETPRLELLACTQEMLDAAVENNVKLSIAARAQVPDSWPAKDMADVQGYFAQRQHQNPDLFGWWAWYMFLPEPRVLIGSLGFNGPPDDDGIVLLGYGVLPEYEGQGFATEAAQAIIAHACSDMRVLRVQSETYPDHAASLRIMEKCGMTYVGPGSEENTVRYEVWNPFHSSVFD